MNESWREKGVGVQLEGQGPANIQMLVFSNRCVSAARMLKKEENDRGSLSITKT